jgi:hypothetical protein
MTTHSKTSALAKSDRDVEADGESVTKRQHPGSLASETPASGGNDLLPSPTENVREAKSRSRNSRNVEISPTSSSLGSLVEAERPNPSVHRPQPNDNKVSSTSPLDPKLRFKLGIESNMSYSNSSTDQQYKIPPHAFQHQSIFNPSLGTQFSSPNPTPFTFVPTQDLHRIVLVEKAKIELFINGAREFETEVPRLLHLLEDLKPLQTESGMGFQLQNHSNQPWQDIGDQLSKVLKVLTKLIELHQDVSNHSTRNIVLPTQAQDSTPAQPLAPVQKLLTEYWDEVGSANAIRDELYELDANFSGAKHARENAREDGVEPTTPDRKFYESYRNQRRQLMEQFFNFKERAVELQDMCLAQGIDLDLEDFNARELHAFHESLGARENLHGIQESEPLFASTLNPASEPEPLDLKNWQLGVVQSGMDDSHSDQTPIPVGSEVF